MTDPEILALLRRHDDPKECEWPRDFDYEDAYSEVCALVGPVSTLLGRNNLKTDGNVQDASFFTTLRDDVQFSNLILSRIAIYFSSFGRLFYLENGSQEGEHIAAPYPEPQVRKVIELLEGKNFVHVPESAVLRSSYDGANPHFENMDYDFTWFDRYFSYL